MGRTIKLLLYYFAYNVAFIGTFLCGYMIYNGTAELPSSTDSIYATLILLAQLLATVAVGVHLIIGKYVPLDRDTWSCRSGKVLLTSILFILGMGWWTNYLIEISHLPNNIQETVEMMVRHPLGVIAIVIMAPIVEELLFRGAIQGHLMRKWKNPAWAIVVSSLVFGLVHGNWIQAPFAFLVGLSLGWMYYRSGSLIPGILMHFINNGTAVLGFLLSDKPDATMVSMYGPTGAAGIAVAGIALTLISIWYVRKLIPTTPVWRKEEISSTDTNE